jgi:alanine racemase
MAEKQQKPRFQLVTRMGFRELGETELDLCSIKDKRQKFGICMDMLMVDVTEIDCTEGDRNYFWRKPNGFLHR